MKSLLFAVALSVSGSAFSKDVQVDGYFKQDGTYVAPHHRTAPDRNPNNNYGVIGNPYNPTPQPLPSPNTIYNPHDYQRR